MLFNSWVLTILWLAAMIVATFGGPTLFFAGLWHLFHKLTGKPTGQYYSHGEQMITKGFLSTCALGGVAIVVLMVSSIGANITARMGSARVVTVADSSYAGRYVRIRLGNLPEANRGSLREGSLLFMKASPDKWGYRKVLLVKNDSLRKALSSTKEMTLAPLTVINRYPAKPFAWLGPIPKLDYTIAKGPKRESVKDGLVFYTALR